MKKSAIFKKVIVSTMLILPIITTNVFASTKWVKDNIGWKYLSNNNYAKNQWILENGKTYYITNNEYMATGKIYLNGVIYEFNSNGELINNKMNNISLNSINSKKQIKVFYNKNTFKMLTYTKDLTQQLTDILPPYPENIACYGDYSQYDSIIIDYDDSFDYEPWNYDFQNDNGTFKLVKITTTNINIQ